MPEDKSYRLLMLIAKPELALKAEDLLEGLDIASTHVMKGQGTASSDLRSMFGLGTTDKGLLAVLMPRDSASRTLRLFRQKLYLGMPNTGVAFTMPLSGASRRLLGFIDANVVDEGGRDMAEDREFCMIVAIVNQGCSDEVMDAARPAGATGGTVLHSRRLESGKATKLWNISIQEERELVMILARNSRKKEIMEAVNKRCGMDSEANGIVFSLPIADIEGLA